MIPPSCLRSRLPALVHPAWVAPEVLRTEVHYHAHDPDPVVIDLTDAHIWDASTVATLDAITTRSVDRGATVHINGMNAHSRLRHTRLAGHLAGGH
ncbi:hypothetical protein [Pseudonocardia sp. GCM10023141]|uniref:hypothetical protein n=1 Tax=Pseudonocardia sp. GCM10023141 TaxID=3252653 RepID=UPI00361CD29D